jgi:hypothetical protein
MNMPGSMLARAFRLAVSSVMLRLAKVASKFGGVSREPSMFSRPMSADSSKKPTTVNDFPLSWTGAPTAMSNALATDCER